MSDEIDRLIEEVERLIKERDKYKQQARDLFDPLFEDKTLEEMFADIDKQQKEFMNRLKPRSQKRAESYDEVIKELKEKLNKPTGKPN